MELCRCGRPITYKPHCPYCGSTFVTGKTANGAWTKNAKGEQVTALPYRCSVTGDSILGVSVSQNKQSWEVFRF